MFLVWVPYLVETRAGVGLPKPVPLSKIKLLLTNSLESPGAE